MLLCSLSDGVCACAEHQAHSIDEKERETDFLCHPGGAWPCAVPRRRETGDRVNQQYSSESVFSDE